MNDVDIKSRIIKSTQLFLTQTPTNFIKMKFAYSHYYASLLLSGQMLSSSAVESSETCPQKYTSLLPQCALDKKVAGKKLSQCNEWEDSGEASCPNLRPYLPHKFQMVKTNGKDYLRYSGGSANLPESGTAG